MAYRHKDLEVCCAAACERTTRFSSQASQARMQMAADRKVLPLKIGIRVYGTGQYSGDYTVEDTGGKVDGHHIDLYMPSQAEEKKFGRQRVKVVVLKYGDDEAGPADPQQKADAKAVNRNGRRNAKRNPAK